MTQITNRPKDDTPKRIAWFSCGAASAVAAKISNPDIIAYCDTGSEDEDNYRFLRECEEWFGKKVTILRNPKYKDTWEVWEKRRYLAGINGAPCTYELKRKLREEFQRPGDTHIFGYTADGADVKRAERIVETYSDLNFEFPLIERSLTKANVIAMIQSAGIKPPRVYEMGFPNANCIPCVKSSSPAYWALVRREFPEQFNRMVELSRRLGARLVRIKGKRAFIDEIPEDQPIKDPVTPACDLLCQATLNEIVIKEEEGDVL